MQFKFGCNSHGSKISFYVGVGWKIWSIYVFPLLTWAREELNDKKGRNKNLLSWTMNFVHCSLYAKVALASWIQIFPPIKQTSLCEVVTQTSCRLILKNILHLECNIWDVMRVLKILHLCNLLSRLFTCKARDRTALSTESNTDLQGPCQATSSEFSCPNTFL